MNSSGDIMAGMMAPAAYSMPQNGGLTSVIGGYNGAPNVFPVPAASSNAEMMRMLAAEVARLQVKVKEKRAREAAAKAADSEATMLAHLMAQIGELKKELGEE